MRGTHAGLVVFAGIATVNIGNALFQLIVARNLGPSDYSEVVSLLALAGLVGLPLGALQLLVARYVAGDVASGHTDAVSSVTRRNLALASVLAVAVAGTLLVLSPAIGSLFSIDGWWPVALTALIALPTLPTPVLWGLAQGLQRFGTLSLSMASGTIVRLLCVVVLTAAGLSVSGAIAATLVGSVVSLLVPAAMMPNWLLRRRGNAPAPATSELARAVVPIAIGTLAIASLTTTDLIIAKIALTGDQAGFYGGASLIGRLILYVPAAIATVLLPKVSSRVAAQRGTDDILGASLAVTMLISLAMLAVLIVVPTMIVNVSLGSDYHAATPLLGLFGISMTGYALLNVLLIYHLGRGEKSMSWLLLGGAVAQLAGFAAFHDSSTQLIMVSIVTAGALLVAHEVLIMRSSRSTLSWLHGALTVLGDRPSARKRS